MRLLRQSARPLRESPIFPGLKGPVAVSRTPLCRTRPACASVLKAPFSKQKGLCGGTHRPSLLHLSPLWEASHRSATFRANHPLRTARAWAIVQPRRGSPAPRSPTGGRCGCQIRSAWIVGSASRGHATRVHEPKRYRAPLEGGNQRRQESACDRHPYRRETRASRESSPGSELAP
jgi:hypothetical protein